MKRIYFIIPTRLKLQLCQFIFTSAAAAAAKSLQSCPTLCDPIDGPTRLPHPWDSPGKNTGVGCHFLLQCMKVKSEIEVAQSCPTLCDPMDCSLPLQHTRDSREQSGKPKVPNYNEGGRVFCHWRPLDLGWEGSAPPDCSLDWPGIMVLCQFDTPL